MSDDRIEVNKYRNRKTEKAIESTELGASKTVRNPNFLGSESKSSEKSRFELVIDEWNTYLSGAN